MLAAACAKGKNLLAYVFCKSLKIKAESCSIAINLFAYRQFSVFLIIFVQICGDYMWPGIKDIYLFLLACCKTFALSYLLFKAWRGSFEAQKEHKNRTI